MDSRGNRGDTQGQPYDNEHGRPWSMLRERQLVNIRKRSFTGSARESELLIVPLVSQGQHNLGRGKGQYLHHASYGEKERRLRQRYKLQMFRELRWKLCQRPNESECLWKKMIGKPYSGKPNVRFDEGGAGNRASSHYASSLLY